jgi:hypothetical protein
VRSDDNAAFWLAPLAATLPLIPFFSLPASPLFLGRLAAGDPVNPFLWATWGPWLAALAVIFDGTLLAYFMAVPIYLVLGAGERLSTPRVLLLFSAAGVVASQLVRVLQGFRQPLLRDFAVSWLSPLFGCLCGLAAGTCFVLLARRRFPVAGRALAYSLPVAVVMVSGSLLMWSAQVWRAR